MKKHWSRPITINALIAFSCYATSYIALSKALPPGYSTPLWPAAGISIACALIFGIRAAPGIWLGAFTLNLLHDEFWNNPQNVELLLFGLSLSVATISTAQAYFARYLTRRILGLPLQLDHLRCVFFYFFLILPLSCLIASTLGSLALVVFHKSPKDFAGITWLTWWIGDLVGAALFSVITLCLFGKPRNLWRPRRWLLGIPIAIIIVSLVFLYHKTAVWHSERIQEHVEHHRIQLDLEFALIKRNSDVRWADFLEILPHDDPLPTLRDPEFISLMKERYPNIQRLQLLKGSGESLLIWNKVPGPFDAFRGLSKSPSDMLKPDEAASHHRTPSELFAMSREQLGILHKARIGSIREEAMQIIAIADLTDELRSRLTHHDQNGFAVSFGPKPSIQVQAIEERNPFVVRSSSIFQQVAYSVSIPMVKVIESSSFEYTIVMFFSVIFTLTVLSLLLVSSGQSYRFEQLFHERTAALAEQKIITENASKLAALGEMAGSIAHEINNPLTIIQGYSEILQSKLKRGNFDSHEIKNGLSRIEQTCRRISAIIVSLRSYARNDAKDQQTVCSLREIISETLELCREGLKDKSIDIIWDMEPGVDYRVLANKAGLMQVLLNLIANARDAVTSLAVRWIRITIEDQQDNDLIIRVSDSGQGIPMELQEKIMTPFFTTKPIGQGTGLGLSISRNLMHAMDGDLDLDRGGEHTSFRIRLKKESSAETTRSSALLTLTPS